MLLHVLAVFVGVSGALADIGTQTVSCDHRDRFPCVNGECIFRFNWCDGLPDCSDRSDENFCHEDHCLESHFQCRSGGCIPKSGVCDDYADCKDGSDEEACHESVIIPAVNDRSSGRRTADETEAVAKAAKFFLGRMAENGWGDFTPRAVVALSFADRASPIGEEEKALMVKQFNIYLRADLLHNGVKTLSELALAVNALYATCQDPRSFQGKDLVKMLRSHTDAMMKSDFTYPAALLTLCIADQVGRYDMQKLLDMYTASNMTSFKALVTMAMVCIGRKTGYVEQQLMVDVMASDSSVQKADIYTKALYLQATHAVGSKSNVQLTNDQLSDGSFGDMLATYYAVPALLNSSLLDLRCNSSKHRGLDVRNGMAPNKGKVLYSLWMTSDAAINTHSIELAFEGDLTFYDIMRMAAARDPLYSFLCDETDEGKKVYSLAGIPNDAETEKPWVLYEATADAVSVQTPNYLAENNLGVDRIYPKDKDHFVFWLKR